MREAGAIEPATLASEPLRPAPHHEAGRLHRRHSRGRSIVSAVHTKTATGKQKGKSQGSRSIGVALRLDLAEARGVELTAGQPTVHFRITEGPAGLRRQVDRIRSSRHAAEALAPLERREQGPEPLDSRLAGMGGWRRCEKGGNRTAARGTHTLTRTLTGTYTRTITIVRIATNHEDPLGQGLG